MTRVPVVEGGDRLAKKFRALSENVHLEVAKAIEAGALDIRNTAIEFIRQGPKTGVVRVVTKAGKTHQASAPGEPPANDTGTLLNSINVAVDAKKLEATVGTKLGYGAHLEFGTTKMRARPWLHPALVANRRGILRRMAKVLNKSNRKVARK